MEDPSAGFRPKDVYLLGVLVASRSRLELPTRPDGLSREERRAGALLDPPMIQPTHASHLVRLVQQSAQSRLGNGSLSILLQEGSVQSHSVQPLKQSDTNPVETSLVFRRPRRSGSRRSRTDRLLRRRQ